MKHGPFKLQVRRVEPVVGLVWNLLAVQHDPLAECVGQVGGGRKTGPAILNVWQAND